MLPQWLNIIGLCFDIVGALILFFFGAPPFVIPSGENRYYADEPSEAEKRKIALHSGISRAGLGLLLLGFAGQLLGSLLQLCAA